MADTQLAKKDDKPQLIETVNVDNSQYAMFLDKAEFEQGWRAATLLSKSTLLPDHYRGKPENCFLLFSMAKQLDVSETVLGQKTYVIGGKMGMEATVMIALVNMKGPFKGRIMYKLHTDGAKITGCTAFATLKDTGEKCEFTVTKEMVEAEGWNKKSGSKWLTLPSLMYCYRAATYLIRLYCPEVILGIHVRDELDDINDQPRPEKTLPVSDLNARLSKKVESISVESEPSVSVEPDIDAEIAAAKDADDEVWPDDAQDAPKSSITPAPEPQAAQGIDPSERYYCNKCGKVFPAPTGAKKNLCRHCLSEDIVDRMKQE